MRNYEIKNFFKCLVILFIYYIFLLLLVHDEKDFDFMTMEFIVFLIFLLVDNNLRIFEVLDIGTVRIFVFLKMFTFVIISFFSYCFNGDYLDYYFFINIIEVLIVFFKTIQTKETCISMKQSEDCKPFTIKKALNLDGTKKKLFLIEDYENIKVDDDVFDFKRILETCNTIFESFKSNKKTKVFGLVANWGYGKTSLINMLKEKNAFEELKEIDISNYKNDSKLYDEIIGEILSALGENSSLNDELENIKAAFLASPNTALISVLIKGNRVQETINKINTKLMDKDKCVYILFDNLDRTNKEFIDLIFKVSKNIFKYNVVFILCYDKERLNNIFNEELKFDKKYFDKYIDYEFALPKISKEKLINVSCRLLEKVFDNYNIRDELYEYEEKERYLQILFDRIKYPRDIIRFINFISIKLFSYSKYDIDLDIYDLLAIIYIQYYEYDLFELIYNNKDILVDSGVADETKFEKIPFSINELDKTTKCLFLFMFSNISRMFKANEKPNEINLSLKCNEKKNNSIKEFYAFYSYFDFNRTIEFNYNTEITDLINDINDGKFNFDIAKISNSVFENKLSLRLKEINSIYQYLSYIISEYRKKFDSYSINLYDIMINHVGKTVLVFYSNSLCQLLFEKDFAIYLDVFSSSFFPLRIKNECFEFNEKTKEFLEERFKNNIDVFFADDYFYHYRFYRIKDNEVIKDILLRKFGSTINKNNFLKFFTEYFRKSAYGLYSVDVDSFKKDCEMFNIKHEFISEEISKERKLNNTQRRVFEIYQKEVAGTLDREEEYRFDGNEINYKEL